jgi:hypothetical protein
MYRPHPSPLRWRTLQSSGLGRGRALLYARGAFSLPPKFCAPPMREEDQLTLLARAQGFARYTWVGASRSHVNCPSRKINSAT